MLRLKYNLNAVNRKQSVNLNCAYLSFNCVDIEYLKTMEQILNMPNVPFELT